MLMGILSFLFGCDAKKSPFAKVDGAWRYHETTIANADPATFAALDDHHAKDKARVFYADTYRDGKEYFSIRHDRIVEIAGADPASFGIMSGGYARDARGVYFEGVRFPVKDLATFELLDYGFARDRVTGYYHQKVVDGSAGPTFAALDTHYAKDVARVYFCDLETDGGAHPYVVRAVPLRDADPASFRVLENGYAVDRSQVYFRDRILARNVASFTALGRDYGKTPTQVFYRGDPIAGADAATFVLLDPSTDAADARDARATYLLGKRTAAPPA